jgi:hypothetical protein
MRPLAAIVAGVCWLWLMAPTYDQSTALVLVTLAIGIALIVGGLFGVALKLREACK